MFPQPMLRSELRPDDSRADPTHTLEQHILAGFPPDLALDLVLNELVVRAADATHASDAALALARGDEMVCRAASGHLAPDLGVPLDTREGLSGACLQTRRPQLSVDTKFDPRVDPAISSHLGIRSILIVPVFDSSDANAPLTGILEVFSHSPAAFSDTEQKLLEGFAEECARVRHFALEPSQPKPAAALVTSTVIPLPFVAGSPLPPNRPPYEAWTLVLGGLAILAIVAVSILIGSRIGWLSPAASRAPVSQPIPANSIQTGPVGSDPTKSNPKSAVTRSAKAVPAKSPDSTPLAAGELVVYQKGKVIFHMNSGSTKPDQEKNRQAKADTTKADSAREGSKGVVEASSTTKLAPSQSVWLSPEQAAARLLSRSEPEYPPKARSARRTGNVVLEVRVAEDGSVSSIRTLSGDPVLATAAAEAVRNWRYEPYRLNDRPAQFDTDVTLSFTLPN